jgi:hypothetical protein
MAVDFLQLIFSPEAKQNKLRVVMVFFRLEISSDVKGGVVCKILILDDRAS